jgi:hypothetical protein
MQILIEHINQNLFDFINVFEKNSLFDNVYDALQSPLKDSHKNLLKYMFKLIEQSIEKKNNELFSLNIHFEKNLTDEEKTLVAEFLWHYHFQSSHFFTKTNQINKFLENKISILKNSTSQEVNLPYLDPMATKDEKKRNKAKTEGIKEKRQIDKKHLVFYNSLKKTATLSPATIINLKVNQEKDLSAFFLYNPTYLKVEEKISDLSSFVLYNTQAFNEIRTSQINGFPLLKIIENIILFDCENSIQRFTPFNYQQLSNFNQNHNTNFRKLIIVTFSNKENLNAVSTKINRLKERYFIPQGSSYIVTKSELKLLTNEYLSDNLKINFIEPTNSPFWEDYFTETKRNGLYELRSIKMMNIYALCLSEDIKRYIINDIFTIGISTSLVTNETKLDILNLPQIEIDSLKNLLINILDVIIRSDIKSKINETLTNKTKVLLNDFILNNKVLFTLIRQNININGSRFFLNWDDIEGGVNGHIVLLSYRDQGNFNHHFYPSINELNLFRGAKVDAILPAFLFKQTYEWSQYNLLKDYQKMIDHQIRRSFFEWDDLKNKIFHLKPEKTIDISWDLESDYSSYDTRTIYRVIFTDNSRSTCNPSDLMIYREGESNQIRIATIKWIYENIDLSNNLLCVQKLDDLIDEFNPAEKIIDTVQQNNDLEIIKQQFEINEEDAGRLWKILLARKVKNYGVNQLYDELKTLFKRNNLDIVSLNHFESTWIQPTSESLVPRGNKVFKVICDYLNLPITYRRIIYTIKNRTITGKRNATKIYSKLLKDLFNDGCFDENANPIQTLSDKINHYKNNHDLDELGIDEVKPLEGLNTLIELIQPELSCNKVRNIEKNEQ